MAKIFGAEKMAMWRIKIKKLAKVSRKSENASETEKKLFKNQEKFQKSGEEISQCTWKMEKVKKQVKDGISIQEKCNSRTIKWRRSGELRKKSEVKRRS